MHHIPCPDRIIAELGDGFSIGAILGTIWYMIKGSYYSVPKERLIGGLRLVRKRAPILGGAFAMWSGLFNTSSCIMIHYRQKEDAINSIVGGATTGFVLAIRGGVRKAIGPAIFGGIFLGVIEIVGALFSAKQMRNQIQEQNKMIDAYIKQTERSRNMFPKI